MNEKSHALNLLVALEYLWKKRWFVVGGTAFAALLGLLYSLLAPPVFVVRAVIYPQDIAAGSDKPAFGSAIGGALNPLLGVGHLNRVEILLRSREMARQVIVKNKLIPELFPADWASVKDPAKDENSPATLYNGVEALRQMVSTQVDVYKMTLEIKTRSSDPALALKITRGYLEALNERMKENVVRNADANREFLETQMTRTTDPWSREKIQELIISEVEKSMLLNASAFEILEAPEKPLFRESPKRKKIVVISLFVGFLASCVGVLGWRGFTALRSQLKTSAA